MTHIRRTHRSAWSELRHASSQGLVRSLMTKAAGKAEHLTASLRAPRDFSRPGEELTCNMKWISGVEAHREEACTVCRHGLDQPQVQVSVQHHINAWIQNLRIFMQQAWTRSARCRRAHS